MTINYEQTQFIVELAKKMSEDFSKSSLDEIASACESRAKILMDYKNTYDPKADKTVNHIRCGEEAKEAIETFVMLAYYSRKLISLTENK